MILNNYLQKIGNFYVLFFYKTYNYFTYTFIICKISLKNKILIINKEKNVRK